MDFIFFTPFLIPIVIATLGAVLDSVMKEGQQLAVDQAKITTGKGIGKILFHFSKYTHHFYFGCFAFDLAALVPFKMEYESLYSISISYYGKDLCYTLAFIALGIVIHLLAYIHTLLIKREVEQKRANRPITYLHLLYLPVSILLLVLIRW
jgi:hypothetical protein